MKYNLKAKLSFTIAVVVLLTVASISILANFFIGNQFRDYIKDQQEKTTLEIVRNISKQYDDNLKSWDVDFVHTIGMNALNDGYIVKVYNLQNEIVWDAEACDMSLCEEVIDEISHRMLLEYPDMKGEYKTEKFSALQGNQLVGNITISYFGPYFLSEADFQFLDSLNKILIGIGIFSLFLAVIAGIIFANRLSRPILETIGAAKQISDGNYEVRIGEKTNTKEINDLIDSVNQLAGTLESQEMLRRRLTADMAHELRTPLTSVQTHLEAMIEGVWEPTKDRLQSCYDEMTRITKLVGDMESLAKLENDIIKLDKSAVNLFELSKKTIGNFEPEIAAKNQQVTLTGACSDILADQDRINQVLINLLSNGIKYTPIGGKIWISLDETDNSVEISVKDTGTGIAENEIPFIFERFYRGDKSRNRMTGGTGIGLAIVKSIIIAHEGNITVESKLGEGSNFTITLPKSSSS